MKTPYITLISIVGLLNLSCLRPANGADAPLPISPVLQALVDQQLVSGAVALVADKDKVLELDAVG